MLIHLNLEASAVLITEGNIRSYSAEVKTKFSRYTKMTHLSPGQIYSFDRILTKIRTYLSEKSVCTRHRWPKAHHVTTASSRDHSFFTCEGFGKTSSNSLPKGASQSSRLFTGNGGTIMRGRCHGDAAVVTVMEEAKRIESELLTNCCKISNVHLRFIVTW